MWENGDTDVVGPTQPFRLLFSMKNYNGALRIHLLLFLC